jgi:hypothetical protein
MPKSSRVSLTSQFDRCYEFDDPINTTQVTDPCKECFIDFLNDGGSCVLKPHKLVENCADYDVINNVCLECQEGFVLDAFSSAPFCAWNRKGSDGVTVIETAVPSWSSQVIARYSAAL